MPASRERARHARHLLDRHAFLHQLQQPVGRHFQPARDRDAAAVGQLLAQPGVKVFSKRMLPHHEMSTLAPLQLGGQRTQRLRRRGLVDEVKAGLPGLLHDGLDAVDQRRGRCLLVARDVVEAHVAEAALLPVAAVRDGELVPAAVGPQPVHRVEHVEQRQVAVQRQAVPGRRARLLERHVGLGEVDVAHAAGGVVAHEAAHQALPRAPALQMLDQREQRAFAGVQRDEVEEVEHARLGQLAQLGVDEAAAERGDHVRVPRLDGLRDAQRRVHRAGKRHRQQHQRAAGADRLPRASAWPARSSTRLGGCGERLGQRIEGGLAGASYSA